MGKDAYCNARKHGDDWDPSNREKIPPGPNYGGEGYCKCMAGFGTDHEGEGRCKLHGGLGYRMKHGLYSENLRGELKEQLREAQGKDAPGDQWEEVAVLRMLMTRYLGKIDDRLTDGGDLEADDLQAVRKIQDSLRKTIDTIHEIEMRTRPTESEVARLVKGMGSILEKYVKEGEREDAIEELRSLAGSTDVKQLPGAE